MCADAFAGNRSQSVDTGANGVAYRSRSGSGDGHSPADLTRAQIASSMQTRNGRRPSGDLSLRGGIKQRLRSPPAATLASLSSTRIAEPLSGDLCLGTPFLFPDNCTIGHKYTAFCSSRRRGSQRFQILDSMRRAEAERQF
jgi:hypothetical protein